MTVIVAEPAPKASTVALIPAPVTVMAVASLVSHVTVGAVIVPPDASVTLTLNSSTSPIASANASRENVTVAGPVGGGGGGGGGGSITYLSRAVPAAARRNYTSQQDHDSNQTKNLHTFPPVVETCIDEA